LLVAANDGVGTKVKIAAETGLHDGVGIDLVAMCVNDLIVQGAEPLFFLDYFACGKLDVDVAADVVKGIAAGCSLAGAALIGGETAEMPDMYADGEYDLAGFCVGAVERDAIIDGSGIGPGDALIGIASSGPHSNGYSLIRKVLELAGDSNIDGVPASERLLTPTRIYVKAVLELMNAVSIRGLAHITGGGITENLPRILDDAVHAEIDTASWEQGPVFDWLADAGNIAVDEMRRTFNCGVGMIVAVDAADAAKSVEILNAAGESAWEIGRIAAGSAPVRFL
jgi:phosphoribosylformylglycinamidine cyclo-ligase